MSRQCYVCGKKTMSGNNVSHSHKKTKRKWKPNLQRIHIIEDGEVKQVRVCTRCMREGKVQRA